MVKNIILWRSRCHQRETGDPSFGKIGINLVIFSGRSPEAVGTQANQLHQRNTLWQPDHDNDDDDGDKDRG